MANIFQNPTKSLPKSDEQIVRVKMEENEIAGRKSHVPTVNKSGILGIAHAPNKG